MDENASRLFGIDLQTLIDLSIYCFCFGLKKKLTHFSEYIQKQMK